MGIMLGILGFSLIAYKMYSNLYKAQRTESLIKRFTKHRNSRLIILKKGKRSYIGISEAAKICAILRRTHADKRIDIILDTFGGKLSAIEMICKSLIHHKGEINVFIPRYAFSGGTIIALLADNIYLGKNAYIGPTDPQLFFPAVSILRALNTNESNHDLTIIYGDMAEKAILRTEKLLQQILNKNYSNHVAKQIIHDLNSGQYEHSQVLDYNDLKDHGLHIHNAVPNVIYKIMGYFN